MRTIHVVILLLLALPALAGEEEQLEYRVVTGWKIEKDRLLAKEGAWSIDLVRLAERVDLSALGKGPVAERARKYLAGLPKGKPLSVELGTGPKGALVIGAWPVSDRTEPKDLALVVKIVGPVKIAPGRSPKLEIRIVNRSKKTAHRVVLPRDGSESGWREPHVYFSATAGGKKVEKKPIMRCGMYAHDWHRDIVVLAPGQSVVITSGYVPVGLCLALPAKGTVRLTAHYDYAGGKLKKGAGVPTGPGAMGSTPAFALGSEPVEFRIAAP